MKGTPYVMRRQFMFGPGGAPCSPPPFGSLVAIDLNTGTKKWDVPLGTLGAMLPPGTPAAQAAALGSINLGGAISTAGGVVFIAATMDNALRAFDIETGRELWKGDLPAGGQGDADDLPRPSGRPAVRRDRGGRRWRGVRAG